MIEFRSVDKAFGSRIILDSASFRVNPGERAGLIGANGSGKSTVFSLLLGEVSEDNGEIAVPLSAAIGHLRQHLDEQEKATPLAEFAENARPELQRLHEEMRAVEARLEQLSGDARDEALAQLGELQTRFEHLGGYEVAHRARAILSGLGFAETDLARPVAEFSGGWQMRAELARVITGTPDILLLDEPSNFLDLPAVEWLRGFLADFQGTLLLISHDRYLLNRLTDITLELACGTITRYAGPYDLYLQQREQRAEQLLAAQRNQQRKRQQIERFVERFRSKATKASQVQSRIKMLDKMEEISVPDTVLTEPTIRLPSPKRAGAEVIRLENVRFGYSEDATVFRSLDFALQRGDRTAIVGYNGSGKTTLLRLLAGRLQPLQGTRKVGANVDIGYLAQDSAETMDPGDTVWQVAWNASRDDVGEGDVRSLLGALRFSGDDVFKPVSVLSGGERMRLALARLLVNPPNLLFLDEPTTHLDIASRTALERAICDFGGTVCLVSHDVAFVRAVATRIFELHDRHGFEYAGGYDYYREKKQRDAENQADDGGAELETPPPRGSQRKRERRREAEKRQQSQKLRKPLQQRMQVAEDTIESLDEEQEALVEELAGTLSPDRYATVNRRLAEIQQQTDRWTREWESAATALEEMQGDAP